MNVIDTPSNMLIQNKIRSFKPNQKASRATKKLSNGEESSLAAAQSGIKISAIGASQTKLNKAHPDVHTSGSKKQYAGDNTIIVESGK